MLKSTYSWMSSKVHSPYATPLLAFLFYIEAILFLPTDPMLMLYCMERRNYALYYAMVATIASVLGGLTGYCIGYVLWHTVGDQIIHNPVVTYFVKPDTFTHLCNLFKKYEWWALLVAGIPPIPFKAATLAAGFCQLALLPFIICSFIVRGSRFFLLALIIKKWGTPMKEYIDRYLNWLALFAFLMIALIFYVYKIKG
jgi:membrane protein YqaA with SNARE-associated domain